MDLRVSYLEYCTYDTVGSKLESGPIEKGTVLSNNCTVALDETRAVRTHTKFTA